MKEKMEKKTKDAQILHNPMTNGHLGKGKKKRKIEAIILF
jgi:hypothetical protein